MKVMVIADREEPGLWDWYSPKKTEGVELILSCGDLSPRYLEFLVTMVNVPLFFVRGNHDGIYDRVFPEGCTDIDDVIYTVNGLRILGLGGSYRYRPGSDMYTEDQMAHRVRRLKTKLAVAGGFDILVTHAPARGYGDLDDLAHSGFEVFNELLEKYHPKYMFYGHCHKEYGQFERQTVHPSGTVLVNAWGHMILDIPAGDSLRKPPGKIADWYLRYNKK